MRRPSGSPEALRPTSCEDAGRFRSPTNVELYNLCGHVFRSDSSTHGAPDAPPIVPARADYVA